MAPDVCSCLVYLRRRGTGVIAQAADVLDLSDLRKLAEFRKSRIGGARYPQWRALAVGKTDDVGAEYPQQAVVEEVECVLKRANMQMPTTAQLVAQGWSEAVVGVLCFNGSATEKDKEPWKRLGRWTEHIGDWKTANLFDDICSVALSEGPFRGILAEDGRWWPWWQQPQLRPVSTWTSLSDAAFNVVQAEINRRRTSRSEPERRHRAGAQGTAAEPTLNALPPPPASVLALPGAISAAAAAAPGSADADSAATDSASADSAQPSAASVSAAAAPGDKPAKRARWAPDVISPALSRQSTLPRPRSGAPSQGSQAPAPRLAPRSAASAAAASSAAADSAATDFASADSAQPSAASVSAAAGSKGSAAPQVQRTGLRSAGPPTNVIDVDSDEGDYSGKPAVVKRSKRSRGQDEGDNAGEPAAAKRSKKSNSNEWIKQFALPMHELLGLTGDIDTFPCVEGVFSLQNAQKHCSKATDSTLVVLPQGAVSVQSVRTFAFHISVTSLALLPPTAHRTLHPYLTSRFPPRFRRPSLRSGMPILVSFPLK